MLISVSARVVTVPAVNYQDTGGSLSLQDISSICVDSCYADSVDNHGLTTIPPKLIDFGRTFAKDLQPYVSQHVQVKTSANHADCSIWITLNPQGDYHDVAGRWTSEGYTLNVTNNKVVISGASSLGAWWGTRTVLQLVALGNGTIPAGTVQDAPGWATRGSMLDVSRKYYPPQFLKEMCSYLSFFKQNEFHIHLSDDATTVIDDPNFPLLQSMWAWRLNSDNPAVAGLASPKNESYTKEVFDDVQRVCASRGVTVIPELESPGHALAITRWKPEIALHGNPTMLNISHPDTIPTIKTIWSTFLPWFHAKTVHIGADEYSSDFIPQYNQFVNTMDEFLEQTGNRSIRIWAAFPTGDTDNEVHRDVVIQHWFPITDNPLFDFLRKGYRVINSDVATYIVTTDNSYFGTRLNVSRIFNGNPSGGGYYPWVFSLTNMTNNPAPNDPQVVGQIAATWNDRPWAAPTWTAYIGWRDGLPALGDKQWGGDLTKDEYYSVFDRLHAAIPDQNLDGWIPTRSSTIIHYTLANNVKDISGNGYHGVNHGCKFANGALVLDGKCCVQTPLVRKGLNYTLSFDVYHDDASSGALFTNEDSSFVVGSGNLNNFTFVSEGFPIRLNCSLPSKTWTHVLLSSDSRNTWVRVNNATTAQTFNTYLLRQ